jgi:heme exporter protein C
MNYLLLTLSVGLALFLGFFPKIDKPKPYWWKIVVILLVTLNCILTIIPPISGNFSDVREFANLNSFNKVNAYVEIDFSKSIDSNGFTIASIRELDKFHFTKEQVTLRSSLVYIEKLKVNPELKSNKPLIVNITYDTTLNAYKFNHLVSVEPLLTYPHLAALLDRVKILNFHVPMSWTAFIAFIISGVYAIQYLRKKDLDFDTKASSANLLGLIFTIMATTTGMLWAKFNWGAFWNWDPRQTSIFILLMIYFAYFALRYSIDEENLKAKLSAVYSVISAVIMPFLIFILPRLYVGLHPGAKADGTTGPVISNQKGMLDSSLALTYYLALAGFILLFFWLYNLHIRYQKVKKELN